MSNQPFQVRDVAEDYLFITDAQDTEPIREQFGVDFDSFFIRVGEGEYTSVYGIYGIVPVLSKTAYEVL